MYDISLQCKTVCSGLSSRILGCRALLVENGNPFSYFENDLFPFAVEFRFLK